MVCLLNISTIPLKFAIQLLSVLSGQSSRNKPSFVAPLSLWPLITLVAWQWWMDSCRFRVTVIRSPSPCSLTFTAFGRTRPPFSHCFLKLCMCVFHADCARVYVCYQHVAPRRKSQTFPLRLLLTPLQLFFFTRALVPAEDPLGYGQMFCLDRRSSSTYSRISSLFRLQRPAQTKIILLIVFLDLIGKACLNIRYVLIRLMALST